MTLTPPPDLVVEVVNINGDGNYQTFEDIEITYTVTNYGLTAPFEQLWFDEVVSLFFCARGDKPLLHAPLSMGDSK